MTRDVDEHAHDSASRPKPKPKSRLLRYLILAALVFGGVAAYGIVNRHEGDAKLAQWTDAQALPTVDLVSPTPAKEGDTLILPANIAAFYTAPIHSQVSGYVQMWYHDIGAHVTQGELLARIDAPELDQQLERVKGELERAQADYALAQTTAQRWQSLRASQAVSQQTADEKTSDAQARKAQVTAAQANYDRVKALTNFKNIVAPFNGIITARRIDVGALVSSANNNQAGLFDVASTEKVRVYVQVPQIDAGAMHKGLPFALTLPQYPDRKFDGTLETTADAISAQSRSLLVEALFDNKDQLLVPGSYAQAKFALPLDPHKLMVPSSAMVFRNRSPEVAVVKGDKVTLKPITIARDTGSDIEVSAGLDPSDKLVASPSDAIETGDTVRVIKIDGKPVKEAGPAASAEPAEPQQREAAK